MNTISKEIVYDKNQLSYMTFNCAGSKQAYVLSTHYGISMEMGSLSIFGNYTQKNSSGSLSDLFSKYSQFW